MALSCNDVKIPDSKRNLILSPTTQGKITRVSTELRDSCAPAAL